MKYFLLLLACLFLLTQNAQAANKPRLIGVNAHQPQRDVTKEAAVAKWKRFLPNFHNNADTLKNRGGGIVALVAGIVAVGGGYSWAIGALSLPVGIAAVIFGGAMLIAIVTGIKGMRKRRKALSIIGFSLGIVAFALALLIVVLYLL